MSQLPAPAHKVAVITGASRGLGRLITSFLAKQDYAVIINSRGIGELRAAADDLAADGSVSAIPGDVTDPGLRRQLLETAERWGQLNVLVNNASELGDSPLPPLEKSSRETFRRVLEVNTLAPLAFVQERFLS